MNRSLMLACARVKKISIISKVISFFSIILFSSLLHGHGYVDHPKARQQFCVDDGGYWWPDDGSAIPNEACRMAFLESGTFQFVQNIEFAANVTDYHNLDAVKAVVTDGNLCSAGDNAKRGMNLPSTHWQRTTIEPDSNGEFDFIFYGATPHNPSFWEFYLTKPGVDIDNKALTWNDIELIDSKGNIPISQVGGRNVYLAKVKIPVGRTGDAILYTRWQRNDIAGEGFYNCSDITISGSTNPPFEWHDKGYYVKQGTEAQAGDEIWFRVFDTNGNEVVFEKLAISESNQSQAIWAEQLATQVNQTHQQITQIGVRNSEDIIEYSAADTLTNKVWVKNNNYTFALDVKKPTTNQPPQVSLDARFEVNAGESINITVSASDPENTPLSYRWNVPAELRATNTDMATVNIQANTPAQTTNYSISVVVSDGENDVSASTTLAVIVETGGCQTTDPDAANHPAWEASKTYQQGNKVSFNQLVWQANWWNQNSQPSAANEVWKLLSDVELGWQSGIAYNAGDEVDHQGRRWKAQWWTKAEPGKASVWQDIGPAKCGS
ncbi:lytic polysaccharide monooxygenase [Aliikangiella coralliicola]|uniref:Chitin-binding type-3 domain-containing protein n=1 Tax=Aliikangiella coralliicola TaxID=2592383 RepID=A0A545U645_9GAMM|nr:lytic polysaccharide monooxygenase [Aliikangiella coralliicola]TQV84948.1 hypothetical protein FLL46_21380 [Aliikangiella coralliicola]